MTKHKTVVSVSGLAINSAGKYLLTLRNDPINPDLHHKWHIPGGTLEYGEQPEETLNREIREELGVVPILLSHTPIVRSFKYHSLQLVILCYSISLGDQPLTLDLIENIDSRWINLADLEHLPLVAGTANFVTSTHELRIPKVHSAR